ncbi:MAG: response regulator [Planctomycetota bacterium]|nr:response regulator [Planctomycetota bacterium]
MFRWCAVHNLLIMTARNLGFWLAVFFQTGSYYFFSYEVSGMLATNQNYSILIADDDTPAREALRDIVEQEGYRTILASSGVEAVDLIQEVQVHLVLLDMHMPNLTGLETLHLVRQIHTMLPAILVTGDPTETVMRQAHQASVYSVIPKPVNRGMVLYTVMKALTRFYGRLKSGD